MVLDNAESILDPLGSSAQEIYAAVEELSHFSNICLCITSRISTVPPDCEVLDIPTLSVEPARDVFYRIYKNGERHDHIGNILEQLGFHPLSITLLATVAHHNRWNTGQLTREWDKQRTGLLHTQYSKSLAVTIELSLSSPMFQELGSDAKALLGVIAFFPQGVDKKNLDWLFPTIPNRTNIIDKFCILSLTYQSDEFITMLAPLRDHLCPKDPKSSPLLCKTKQCYFSRLSAQVDGPGFEETCWIASEDVNVEYLLDVFTSIDANPSNGWSTYPGFMKHLLGAFASVDTDSGNVWDACADFMRHIYHHKPHLITLGPKIEGLPDSHHSKPECLFWLSQLFHSVGNGVECVRLLTHTLKLCREQGDDFQVAQILVSLSNVNHLLDHLEEGTQQAEEALEIYKELKNEFGQGTSFQQLAVLLSANHQLDAAEEAASQALNLLSSKGNQFDVCQCYRVLGGICRSKGNTEMAVSHFEAALVIASSFNMHSQLFWIHHSLASLLFCQSKFDNAYAHIECAKSRAVNNAYLLGHAMEQQARFLYHQHRFEEAGSEAMCAIGVFEKLGATKDMEDCRKLLQEIKARADQPLPPGNQVMMVSSLNWLCLSCLLTLLC